MASSLRKQPGKYFKTENLEVQQSRTRKGEKVDGDGFLVDFGSLLSHPFGINPPLPSTPPSNSCKTKVIQHTGGGESQPGQRILPALLVVLGQEKKREEKVVR